MRWRTLIAFALMAAVITPTAAITQDSRPGVGVLPFENGGSYGLEAEDFDALEGGMQQMLITELALNTELRVVDRARISDLLAEQDLGAGGRVDANTAARIGKLVGARYMVLGGFIDWYSDFRIDARIVDVETSEIIKVVRPRGKREDLFRMLVDLSDDITQGANLKPLSRQALNQRKDLKVPEEAVRLYTRALLYKDRGNREKAIELFGQVRDQFPDYTPAQEELRQLGG